MISFYWKNLSYLIVLEHFVGSVTINSWSTFKKHVKISFRFRHHLCPYLSMKIVDLIAVVVSRLYFQIFSCIHFLWNKEWISAPNSISSSDFSLHKHEREKQVTHVGFRWQIISYSKERGWFSSFTDDILGTLERLQGSFHWVFLSRRQVYIKFEN